MTKNIVPELGGRVTPVSLDTGRSFEFSTDKQTRAAELRSVRLADVGIRGGDGTVTIRASISADHTVAQKDLPVFLTRMPTVEWASKTLTYPVRSGALGERVIAFCIAKSAEETIELPAAVRKAGGEWQVRVVADHPAARLILASCKARA